MNLFDKFVGKGLGIALLAIAAGALYGVLFLDATHQLPICGLCCWLGLLLIRENPNKKQTHSDRAASC